jgi:hypothetical protein
MIVLYASNNVADWGGTPAIDTTASNYDSTRVPYGMTMVDDTTYSMNTMHKASSTDTAWYHFSLRTSTFSGNGEDGYFGYIYNADGVAVLGIDIQDGQVRAQAFGDTTVTGALFLLPISSSTKWDIRVTVNGTSIIGDIYIDGVIVSTATAANSSGLKTVSRQFVFAFSDAIGGAACWFSEFYVAETSTVNSRMQRRDLTTAGNDSAWTGNLANLSDEDDTTGLTSDTAAQRSSANTVDVSGTPTIGAVVAMARSQRGATGPANLKQYARISAVNYDGDTHALGLDKTSEPMCWELDPSDSGAWTAAKVNAIELGLLSVT